jgi:hypothetical protein
MSWKAERTMSIVLAKHLIGVTQHPSTIIVRVVVASAERLWHTLTSRQAARTPTAPAESVDRAAQLCEPLLVAAAEECIPVHGRGRWTLPLRWTRKQREAAQKQNKLRVQRTVEAVLLSSDLVPHILAPLQLEDGAVVARWLPCARSGKTAGRSCGWAASFRST